MVAEKYVCALKGKALNFRPCMSPCSFWANICAAFTTSASDLRLSFWSALIIITRRVHQQQAPKVIKQWCNVCTIISKLANNPRTEYWDRVSASANSCKSNRLGFKLHRFLSTNALCRNIFWMGWEFHLYDIVRKLLSELQMECFCRKDASRCVASCWFPCSVRGFTQALVCLLN